jgi:hypothetical protein
VASFSAKKFSFGLKKGNGEVEESCFGKLHLSYEKVVMQVTQIG